MLIIFTGNGKGKTTAALGQAIRAVGSGKRVLMVQFIKGPWISGEHNSAKSLDPDLKIVRRGLGFVGICGDNLPIEHHEFAAKQALVYARREALTRRWNMIILDEIWNALKLGLITCKEIDETIQKITPSVEDIITTGRDCPTKFINRADLVTEMKEIRHPFNAGIMARKGVEF